MNCTAFEKRLERYRAGELPQAERRETDQHLCHCVACRALLEVLQSGESEAGQVDLSEAILTRTTGSACTRCRGLLGDLLDGVLDKVESELIMCHLGSCPSCSSLFGVMSEIADILPRMREINPDPYFVPDVLNSVRPLRHDGVGLSRILDWLRGLTQRPRFSWEAAYLGALLVFGLFGTPFSPVHDASSRLLASLQDREGLIAQAESSIDGWHENAEIVIAASGRARQTVSRLTARSAETAELIIERGGSYVRVSGEYLASTGKAVQGKVVHVYRQVTGSEAVPANR